MANKEFQICTKCVMDVTDPDISFDDRGVCNYCRKLSASEVTRKAEKTRLPWVIHDIKKSGRGEKYDCLIGLSGGVDSSMVLHYLVQQGLRPMAFSVDNGWNTPESDENIMRLVENLKVPFYRYTINISKFKDLQIAFLMSATPNAEIPTDHVLMATTYDMARKYGIKWIISGGNWQTESIMPKAWGYQARDLKHIKGIYRQFMGKRLSGLPVMSMLEYLRDRFVRGIKIVNLLDYYDYDREAAKKLLAEKYGWKDYGEKHCESYFTEWFQSFYLYNKFNIDKRKAHYSSMINSGQMTRAKAMELLPYAPIYKDSVVTLGLHQHIPKGESFRTILERPVKSHKDYPNSERAWDFLSKVYSYFK